MPTPSRKCRRTLSGPSREDAIAELARRRLIDFAILTRQGYVPNWHHRAMADALEAAERGDILRLMIFMPPQHGKSEIASIRFPAWALGRQPKRHIAAASYSGDLATGFGRQVRNLVADPLYESVFETRLSADSAAADRWNTRQGGQYIAAGVGGPLTGRGANLLIIDDPFKDYEEAFSAVIREKVWNWYATVALPRVRKGGIIVLVQTRWHEDDLAGRIEKKAKETGEHWEKVSFPAIAEADEPPYRKAGEPLWPAGKPLRELLLVRATQSTPQWQSLYQQKPPKEQGVIFKREWFPRYQGEPFGDKLRRAIILDTAHKTKDQNDYSCMGVFDSMTGGIFLRHVWREKLTYPALKKKVADMVAIWKPDELGIEDKDAGSMLIQELQAAPRDPAIPATTIPVIPLAAEKDKVLRANAATPMCEAGRVFVPVDGEAPWATEFFDELLAFPAAPHDDQVDVLVHGVNRLKDLGVFLPDPDSVLVETGHVSIGRQLDEPM